MRGLPGEIQIKQKASQVEITFPRSISQEKVSEQVESCIDETCSCCTPTFREKVEGFEKQTDAEGTKVVIKGTITAEEVQENVLSCASKLEDAHD